ncbi:MAG: AAA family ATPase [Phycisphaerales bacterium]|nr:AAA family ATPase [Phycisphaerales bacterium]
MMASRKKSDRPEPREGPLLEGHQPVIGQDAAIEVLRKAMLSERMPSSWVFHGPDGVGKRTAALRLARILLEQDITPESKQAFTPPLDSRAAELVGAGTHPDLVVLRKEMASESQVADLRDKKQMEIPTDLLREHVIGGFVKRENRVFEPAVYHSPYTATRRVFIIEEAELLNQTGQNALLKTLEEPPPATILILLTTNADRLLPTIRSRCQQLAFRRLDEAAMARWLEVAELEADARSLEWAVNFADGSPGKVCFALKYDLQAWHETIEPQLVALEEGRYPEELADEFASLIEEFVKVRGKENRQLSKTRANRDGLDMVLSVVSAHLRRRLHLAIEAGELAAAERMARAVDDLVDAERRGDRALNHKHLLGALVASLAGSMGGEALAT